MYFKIINNPRTNTPRVLVHHVLIPISGGGPEIQDAVEIKAYGIIDKEPNQRLTQKIALMSEVDVRQFIIDFTFEDAEKWCAESGLTSKLLTS